MHGFLWPPHNMLLPRNHCVMFKHAHQSKQLKAECNSQTATFMKTSQLPLKRAHKRKSERRLRWIIGKGKNSPTGRSQDKGLQERTHREGGLKRVLRKMSHSLNIISRAQSTKRWKLMAAWQLSSHQQCRNSQQHLTDFLTFRFWSVHKIAAALVWLV